MKRHCKEAHFSRAALTERQAGRPWLCSATLCFPERAHITDILMILTSINMDYLSRNHKESLHKLLSTLSTSSLHTFSEKCLAHKVASVTANPIYTYI